jgi:hypothetical protein
MAHSLEIIRQHIKVAETTNNKGLALTLVITAYDNGMLHIGNVPVRSGPLDANGGVSALGWLQGSEAIGGYLTEFCRQVEQRRNRT